MTSFHSRSSAATSGPRLSTQASPSAPWSATRRDIMTPSYVKDAERPQVVGRPVTTAFRKGDPILWTHFQNEPPPVVDAKVP
jgi:hypothetical protein